jgi:hypothetical protein
VWASFVLARFSSHSKRLLELRLQCFCEISQLFTRFPKLLQRKIKACRCMSECGVSLLEFLIKMMGDHFFYLRLKNLYRSLMSFELRREFRKQPLCLLIAFVTHQSVLPRSVW